MRLAPQPVFPLRMGRVDLYYPALNSDGTPFSGEADLVYSHAEELKHSQFAGARVAVCFHVPDFGRIVLARFYPVECRCPSKLRKKRGSPCLKPDIRPGSALVQEAQIVAGRQLRPDENPLDFFITGTRLVGRIEIVERSNRTKHHALLSGRGFYSKVARIIGRKETIGQIGRLLPHL